MSGHSPEFIKSEFTVINAGDADKIASVKAALAANVHVFVFLYMDGCGHCVAAEAAWLEFTKKCADRTDAVAFAVSHAAMGSFGSVLGETPFGFPTFRHVHGGKVTEYEGGRSVEELGAWADAKAVPSSSQTGGRRPLVKRRTRRRAKRHTKRPLTKRSLTRRHTKRREKRHTKRHRK